ncbi:DUF488 family protein [Nitratireductor sp. OM-1]|uniref:DUF488 domain-containing protein n=1 Tax=Nitratireductor sp. OM-1 TaxID=1756988 RepID=UPI000DDD32B9|nr:DUF488 domain-containing protein [Nitratireductor sp. OM-1]
MEVWTIGHSNHSFEDFLGLLKQNQITMLIDVRSKPVSRFPHFQRDNLIRGVRSNGVDYRYGGKVLGGLGDVQVTAPLFIAKMDAILQFTEEGHRVAMMCSEGKPCECHRAGKLTAWLHRERPDVKTTHIMRNGALVDARSYEPKVIAEVTWPDFASTMKDQGDFGI